MEELNDETLKCNKPEEKGVLDWFVDNPAMVLPFGVLASPIIMNYWYLTPIVYVGYKYFSQK